MSPEPSQVTAIINYSNPPPDLNERAYFLSTVNPNTGHRDRNISCQPQLTTIENLRGTGEEYSATLDTSGFQFCYAPSVHKTFTDSKEIKSVYYPECIDLIKKATGASRVVIFNRTIRGRTPNDPSLRGLPCRGAHIDFSAQGAFKHLHHYFPDKAHTLLTRRFQIINIWRPISQPAYDHPLALCEYRSVNPEKDFFPATCIYPDHERETLALKHGQGYTWKYLRGITTDEVILIKIFDSSKDKHVAKFAPHTAFDDPSIPEGSTRRESIELRAFVFYD